MSALVEAPRSDAAENRAPADDAEHQAPANATENEAPDENTQNVADRQVVLLADEGIENDEGDLRSLASSSQSLNSSIFDHRFENGRTYHKYKDGKYKLPNDETENDRLDLQHHLFRLTFNGRLANCPLLEQDVDIGRVLDLGCGTGIWCLEIGDEHPEADILGVDLSPTMPEFVAPNVKFEIDDVEESWTYTKPFDYIHSRMMNSNIGDWDAYVKQAYDHLNPGGWLELNECDIAPVSDDGTLREDSSICESVRLLKSAAEQFGRPFKYMSGLKTTLINAGFVDVQLLQFKWPTNPWPADPRYKELAEWMSENLATGWEGVCLAMLTRAHGWTREEVIVFMAQCRAEFRNKHIHAYFSIWSVYGRKPTEAELSRA
ncbi:hypothetical protein CGLO_04696 [Colletotrichum gloeosporioides Cg-14]|uniref:Methyltransferase domain-containing protein n=1 Tax=Colletotrichum gloeosporioides (strain Cg-14) TaxID=1237896 RepID=T0KJ46_COLGC|nr:hypothetical protein CGLO_04696 [Colletotrichum gloeosporioides Cg-14]